jgi:hypothetical protein
MYAVAGAAAGSIGTTGGCGRTQTSQTAHDNDGVTLSFESDRTASVAAIVLSDAKVARRSPPWMSNRLAVAERHFEIRRAHRTQRWTHESHRHPRAVRMARDSRDADDTSKRPSAAPAAEFPCAPNN